MKSKLHPMLSRYGDLSKELRATLGDLGLSIADVQAELKDPVDELLSSVERIDIAG